MKIFFKSKYINLLDDLSFYWDTQELVNAKDITNQDLVMIDVDKVTDEIFNTNAIIWGINTSIVSNDLTLKFHDLIRIPYDLEYIMFKLNKLKIK